MHLHFIGQWAGGVHWLAGIFGYILPPLYTLHRDRICHTLICLKVSDSARTEIIGVIVRVLFFFIAGMVSFPAAAIVNMESLHLGQPEDGWSGRFELSASGSTGNTEKWDAAAGLRLQRHEGVNTSFLVLDYTYSRSLGQTNTDKGFAHLRHIYQYNTDIAYEGFLQAAQDPFARLAYRRLAGAGLRYTLTEPSPQHAWFLGVGAFYEKEQLTNPAPTEDEFDKGWRGNLYLVMKHQFNNQTRFISSTYYQPRLSDTDDFRILERAGLSVSLAEKLSLQLSIDVSYDSEPPLGVRKTDTGYRTGISYQF